MARRTKQDALATRHRLLDAAEQLFQAKGVSRTSLSDIATAAGTTRGAIYWHFKDKADLFNAMMDRVTLPLEESAKRVDDEAQDPLENIRASMTSALQQVASDPQVRRVFDVAMHKVEYVDDMLAVHQRHLSARDECFGHLSNGLGLAGRRREGSQVRNPDAAAWGLIAMVDGLIQNWLLNPEAFDLVSTGRDALEVYLHGLGLSESVPEAPEGNVIAFRTRSNQ
ncbi:MAG: TetR family transcriptional regulator [Burkholderiaceae bacterium]|nr:TetR family transcriptional regulator [Burkholderiaceae bacterium]